MKKFQLLFILFILTSFTFDKSSRTKVLDNSIDVFVSNFEKATMSHDPEKIMLFMEKNYLKEQHDQFLKGRTNQFLNEFFCGTNVSSNKFECPEYQKIDSIEKLSIVKKEEWYEYSFKIRVNAKWLLVKQSIVKKTSKYSKEYGLVGAVG